MSTADADAATTGAGTTGTGTGTGAGMKKGAESGTGQGTAQSDAAAEGPPDEGVGTGGPESAVPTSVAADFGPGPREEAGKPQQPPESGEESRTGPRRESGDAAGSTMVDRGTVGATPAGPGADTRRPTEEAARTEETPTGDAGAGETGGEPAGDQPDSQGKEPLPKRLLHRWQHGHGHRGGHDHRDAA